MLEFFLTIIAGFIAFAMVIGFITGLCEGEGRSSAPYTPSPPDTGPLVPPVFWIYAGAAFCVFALMAKIFNF